MVQCTIVRDSFYSTVWIPRKFAIRGKYLKINGEDGWLVKEVYRFEVTPEYLGIISNSYKNTRKASDI